MTHGREKSDSAIVAGKPTNNVERSTTVPVEPRAEAEGNASQQSTCRAQDRESVSQALERIRQAARQRKKEKFTALCQVGECTYRSRMADSARSRSPLSKTRSFRERWLRC